MSDLISRQAVLDIAKSSKSNWIDNSVLFKRVSGLPSVEPEKCSDCINREALLRKLKKVSIESWKMKLKCNAETVWNQCIDYVKDAPSVEPERKTGKWVEGKCNRCGTHAPFWAMATTYYRSNYCPGCGAKMMEVDE